MDKETRDLANFISLITQDKTPFMSSISKEEATTIYHEWETDLLKDGKTIPVRGFSRHIDKAGFPDKYDYKLKKRGVQILRRR